MNNIGKKGNNVRGRRAPPPLPMYQPVVLKHVPTMVRRRYEHFDVDKLDSDHDHDEDDGLLDASDGDELEEDMGPGEIGSEHGLPESEDTDLQGSNPTNEVNCGVSVECQDSGEGNSTDYCDNDIGAYDETFRNLNIQPTDLQTEYSSSEEKGSEVVNQASVVDSNLEEETRDQTLTELTNEQGECKGDDNGTGDMESDSHPSLKDEALSYGERNSVNERDQYSENSEDDVPVVEDRAIVDFNLDEDETQDMRLAEFVNEQGFHVGDNISEVDGGEDANTPTYPSVKDETFDMTEGNSVNEKGGNHTFSGNASVNGEMRYEISNEEQETLAQMHDEDFGSVNLIRNRSLNLKELKRGCDGTNDINGSTDKDTDVQTELQGDAHQSSNKEVDFNPEAFRKTVKEDGYELCCPVCKHCITNNLIYHRRGNIQHGRATCFTGLLALFCCIRD